MTWVLIAMLFTSNGASLSYEKFDSIQACQAVGKETEKLKGVGWSRLQWTCVYVSDGR
jgi:hypothetical protein